MIQAIKLKDLIVFLNSLFSEKFIIRNIEAFTIINKLNEIASVIITQ